MKMMRGLVVMALLAACGKTTIAQLHLAASQPVPPDQACATPPCPVVMVDKQEAAYALAIDSNNVYWTTLVGGTVMQAPLTSEAATAAPITLATGQTSPFAIAVNFEAVYWANEAPAGQTTPIVAGKGTVTGVIIGNSAATPIADTQSFPVFAIAAGVSNVFWPASNGNIFADVLEGGKPQQIGSGLKAPSAIAIDAKNFYVTSAGTGKNDGVVQKNTYTYLNSKYTIGKTPVVIAAGRNKASALAVDFTDAYWIEPGTILKATLDGSAAASPTTLLTAGTPFALAIDASHVYWTDTAAGTICQAPLAGGNPVILASGQASPISIAVDAANVYWTTSGAVMRISLSK